MSPHCSEHSVLNAEQDADVLIPGLTFTARLRPNDWKEAVVYGARGRAGECLQDGTAHEVPMVKTISIQGLREVSLEPQRGQSCEKGTPPW